MYAVEKAGFFRWATPAFLPASKQGRYDQHEIPQCPEVKKHEVCLGTDQWHRILALKRQLSFTLAIKMYF